MGGSPPAIWLDSTIIPAHVPNSGEPDAARSMIGSASPQRAISPPRAPLLLPRRPASVAAGKVEIWGTGALKIARTTHGEGGGGGNEEDAPDARAGSAGRRRIERRSRGKPPAAQGRRSSSSAPWNAPCTASAHQRSGSRFHCLFFSSCSGRFFFLSKCRCWVLLHLLLRVALLLRFVCGIFFSFFVALGPWLLNVRIP